MRVIGVRSKKINTRYADEVYPPEQLKTVLSQSDFVVVALALTPETNKSIGKDCFLAMKPTAYIINIARGDIIDEPALIQALKDKTIAGAELDAHSLEPLPSESELWKLSNVIITPHIGGATVDYMQKSTLIFLANLKRYLKGQKLLNVVDKQKGH
jgi:D-2-hydroxyacid dehydrogenase (NADP+)